jgi:signal transduction histidine kinase
MLQTPSPETTPATAGGSLPPPPVAGHTQGAPTRAGLGRGLLLPLLAVLLNLALGPWMAEQVGAPFNLGQTGTVLAGLLLGPVAGGLVAALSVSLQALLPDGGALLPALAPALWMGWVAGQAGRRGVLRAPLHLVAAALVAALGAGLLTFVMAAAPGGGVGYWAALGEGLRAAGRAVRTPAGALAGFGGPLLSFLLGALLAWPARRLNPPGLGAAGSALGQVLLAWLVTLIVVWYLMPVLGRPLFVLFFVPVILAVWRRAEEGRVAAGLAAAGLGALGGLLLVAPPLGRGPLLATDWVWLVGFFVVALFLVFVTDLAQRRTDELVRAAAAHRQAEARLAAIAAGVDETLLFVSPNRTVSLVNARFEELFAERADAVQGRPLDEAEDLFARAFADPALFAHFVSETLADATDGEAGAGRDGTGRDGAGDATGTLEQAWPVARELVIRALPVTGNDEYYGRLYLLRDRTRERELDQLYRRIAGVVNDDLRAPSARIRALATTLLDGAGGELSDAQTRLLTTIRANAERQLHLIEKMNEAARLESEQVKLDLGSVDLRALIQATATSMRPLLQEKKQTLTVDVAADLPTIDGDPARLAQVLTNLISNAYKFNPPGGWVRVEARREPVALGKRVRVAVIDGGFGIPRAEQKRLFERFYRVESDQTRGLAGTGLGLTMVAAIVRLHGGEVEVNSQPGRGSTFAFWLPVHQSTAVGGPGARAESTLDDDEPLGVGVEVVAPESDGPSLAASPVSATRGVEDSSAEPVQVEAAEGAAAAIPGADPALAEPTPIQEPAPEALAPEALAPEAPDDLLGAADLAEDTDGALQPAIETSGVEAEGEVQAGAASAVVAAVVAVAVAESEPGSEPGSDGTDLPALPSEEESIVQGADDAAAGAPAEAVKPEAVEPEAVEPEVVVAEAGGAEVVEVTPDDLAVLPVELLALTVPAGDEAAAAEADAQQQGETAAVESSVHPASAPAQPPALEPPDEQGRLAAAIVAALTLVRPPTAAAEPEADNAADHSALESANEALPEAAAEPPLDEPHMDAVTLAAIDALLDMETEPPSAAAPCAVHQEPDAPQPVNRPESQAAFLPEGAVTSGELALEAGGEHGMESTAAARAGEEAMLAELHAAYDPLEETPLPTAPAAPLPPARPAATDFIDPLDPFDSLEEPAPRPS